MRKNWSREEKILALDLYWKIPFSKIGKTNKLIVQLADLIGRTPSAVGLKIANLAHWDPELQARNISGMKNTSKLDKEIFEEFYGRWDQLAYESEIIKSSFGLTETDCYDGVDMSDIPTGADKESVVKTRVGQKFFRESVLGNFNYQCCVTGINSPLLLRASHIKPWRNSDPLTERTNPKNGLCLNNLHDQAFDCGLITLNMNYELIFSKELKNVKMNLGTRDWFYSFKGKKIFLPEHFLPDKKFIEYHNDYIFIQ